MKRRFVAKKSKKFTIIKLLFLIVIINLSLVITFNLLLKNSISNKLGNKEFQSNLVEIGTNQKNLFSLDLLNPRDMFLLSLNYVIDVKSHESHQVDEVKLIKEHVNDENPRIYIYSTHDTEGYNSTIFENYNINYNVKIGSYTLSEHLSDLGIPNYVETESMGDYLNANGLNYNYSYRASKYYIEKRMLEYPSIELIIDFHRDSAPSSVTCTEIDGVKYAKVMFVVGLSELSHDRSLALAEKVNSKIDSRLSRGIFKRNGTYNQDLSEKALLIEVGGVDNTIEEIYNTTRVLANALFETLNGG